MAPPRISFVCALHNCVALTEAMLRSLDATVPLAQHQLIFVDDCSSDGTAAFLDSLARRPEIVTLRNTRNLGYARSNNRGVAHATGEILLLINNDLEFSPNWLPPMLEVLRTAPHAGAVGNVQRNYATGLVDHAGIYFDLEGLPSHAHKNRKNPPRGERLERNAVTAACLALRRATFLEVGGFDEGYQNGCEDVAFCLSLKKAGYRNYVALRSVIRHHVSSSPNRNLHNEKNTARFREQWADYARPLGTKEWAREYLRRYARYWWRLEPRKALKAIQMLATRNR